MLKRINKKKYKKVVDNTIVFWYYIYCQQVVDGKANTRKERNMKRAILYTINFIIFMAMLTFVALLDSDNYIPYLIGFLLCMAWFVLFCYANNYFYHNDR